MSPTMEAPPQFSKARLTPVQCAMCGHPVCHYDASVVGAKAGGMCTRDSCTKDQRTRKPRQVFTFHVVSPSL